MKDVKRHSRQARALGSYRHCQLSGWRCNRKVSTALAQGQLLPCNPILHHTHHCHTIDPAVCCSGINGVEQQPQPKPHAVPD